MSIPSRREPLNAIRVEQSFALPHALLTYPGAESEAVLTPVIGSPGFAEKKMSTAVGQHPTDAYGQAPPSPLLTNYRSPVSNVESTSRAEKARFGSCELFFRQLARPSKRR